MAFRPKLYLSSARNVLRYMSVDARAPSTSRVFVRDSNFDNGYRTRTSDGWHARKQDPRSRDQTRVGEIHSDRRYRMKPHPSSIPEPRRIDLEIKSTAVLVPSFKAKDPFHKSPMSNKWLRDNCSCAQCRNQETGQRQFNVFKGDVDCNIISVEDLSHSDEVKITFGDGHQTIYPKQYLANRRSPYTDYQRQGGVPVTTWDASIACQPPAVRYDSLQANGLGELLHKIRVHGFCFVEGTPATPEATESLLAAIGPIRNTHYGAFYDFTADLSSKDTAYTSESLEPHTDNTYFTEPTGLQALHLLSHTEGSGGESSLVDGFAAANILFNKDRAAYVSLAMTPVYAHASGNEGISIQPASPVPVLSHSPEHGYLTQVRWNNADRAGLQCSIGDIEKWYDSAGKFDAILSDPKNQYWFQLTPGKILIFDNWRVLHGRAAFTGKRRMCGGYINRDDFISRFRMTNMSEEDIRASTVTG